MESMIRRDTPNLQSAEPSRRSSINLLIIARHRLDGEALSMLLQSCDKFHVMWVTTSFDEALVFNHGRHADVVLVDARILGNNQQRNLQALARIVEMGSILLLDDGIHNNRLSVALRFPSVGYFSRDCGTPELIDGICRHALGERVFGTLVHGHLKQSTNGLRLREEVQPSSLTSLTPREMEVLSLIALGNSVRECAERLALACSTVDNHKSRLMKKLGVHKSSELIRIAFREGLVDTDS